MCMIQIENLVKKFRTDAVETTALDHINFSVRKGEFVAVMGPSGCGKSTLLNILGLLDTPTYGSFLLDGVEVGKCSERERTQLRKGNIGFVFQNFNLIDELNVFQNVSLPLNCLHYNRIKKRSLVTDVLDRLNMGHRIRHYPQQLSGGQQQRLAIARAVVANPGLILADEPTGNLDSNNGLEVMKLLAELNKAGTTIVMVTHSSRDALFAHRNVHLFDGRVISKERERVMEVIY